MIIKTRPLGSWVAVASIVIDVAVWAYEWIDASNQPDTWSSWDGPTKEAFVTDALNAAFTQTEIPPRDWFWRATSTAGYSEDDYTTFMDENEWIVLRVKSIEKATGKSWTKVNTITVAKPAIASITNLFSSDNILSTIGGVLFVGIAGYMVYRAINANKE